MKQQHMKEKLYNVAIEVQQPPALQQQIERGGLVSEPDGEKIQEPAGKRVSSSKRERCYQVCYDANKKKRLVHQTPVNTPDEWEAHKACYANCKIGHSDLPTSSSIYLASTTFSFVFLLGFHFFGVYIR